jgi:hypothetical protein
MDDVDRKRYKVCKKIECRFEFSLSDIVGVFDFNDWADDKKRVIRAGQSDNLS